MRMIIHTMGRTSPFCATCYVRLSHRHAARDGFDMVALAGFRLLLALAYVRFLAISILPLANNNFNHLPASGHVIE